MSFKTTMNKAGFWIRKNSPYILFGFGVIGFGATVTSAIVATEKIRPTLNDRDKALDNVEEFYKDDPESDKKKEEIKAINKAAAKDVVKAYVPTAALGVGTIVCFAGSFSIINKRYTGTAIALASLTEAYDAYRERVREEEGGELKDYAYANGLELEEVEETVEDEETGKKKKVKKTILKGVPTGLYAYRYEQYDSANETGAETWDSSSVFTRQYINGVMQKRQRELEHGKYVWLSDILDDFGFGEGVRDGSERIAGWAPGDLILCGLEEIGESTVDPISDEVMEYLYGNGNEVTLIFNPRSNLYGELYEKEDK